MSESVTIITGASRGIGPHIAGYGTSSRSERRRPALPASSA